MARNLLLYNIVRRYMGMLPPVLSQQGHRIPAKPEVTADMLRPGVNGQLVL